MRSHQANSPASSHEAAVPLVPIGRRIAHVLDRRQLSLETLAIRTGAAMGDLRSILEGRTQPTINLLWKIANALDVRPGSLVAYGYTPEFALSRAGNEPRLLSGDGACVSRALSAFRCRAPFEFYGVELAAGTRQQFEAHPPGTYETLTVHKGQIELTVGKEPIRRLEAGDWVQFQADVPHCYENVGNESSSLYLVVSYQLSGSA